MKKMFLTFAVVAVAFSAMALTTSCKKKETVGEKLDKAIENTNSGAKKLTKKAEEAAEQTNDTIEKTIEDLQK